MKNEKYYLGLDIGTDSVGYAVTDTTPNYKLIKFKGEPMWGVTLFDAANTKADRRAHRSARRRLDRRQQRVELVQEIFAKEIYKVDPGFYKRIKESALFRTDAGEPYCLFNDADFTDKEYHDKYPTIHHLISELMISDEAHDARLVYLACAWLVAHRGHFLSEISMENIDKVTDFEMVYNPLMEYFEQSSDNYVAPWKLDNIVNFANVLKKQEGVNNKFRSIVNVLFDGSKCPKGIQKYEEFRFSKESILKLLAGGTVKLKDLYGKEEYSDIEPASISLGMEDEKFDSVITALEDDSELIIKLKAIYDWSVLCNLLAGEKYISLSKVKEYEQHHDDLSFLKYLVKKYIPQEYNNIFRNIVKNNYVSYSGNIKSAKGDKSQFEKSSNYDEFGKYIKKSFEKVEIDPSDYEQYNGMVNRIDLGTFLPKQVTGNNRVIPYQLYYKELEILLSKSEKYLPFLNEVDEDGLSNKEKILSIMKFRVPYFIGPLNDHSEHAWITRKAEGRILPWNFEEKVDFDASEQAFINRMINKCTYLPGEDVLPKHSLLYEKFEVLNEINTLKVNGMRIDEKAKQGIYCDLFLQKRKVTINAIKDYLIKNNYCNTEDLESFSGVDTNIKSALSSHFAFKRLLSTKTLNDVAVEEIIEHATFSEDKSRYSKWIANEFSFLNDDDKRYVSSLKFKDFGNLSKKLLTGIEGTDIRNGETNTIIGFMWEHNVNFMELLADNYTFNQIIDNERQDYYSQHEQTLDQKLDSMYISNSVKRPIFRSFDIINDVVKAMKHPPEKIFIEMARGGDKNKKGKRTLSRKEQLQELYRKVEDEDVKMLSEQLEKMGDSADNKLQSEVLFLYYLQLGKCMYSGEPINIEKLADGTYNIDHIYPQSKVKDDSILNNKVLVLSTYNKDKDDVFPVPSAWRLKMHPFWSRLKEIGLITEEKYNRLTRKHGFTSDEEWGFINRQLVETRQSTKAIATLLNEKYPETEIVYVKAGLVSEFRDIYRMHKCRSINDLHHAKDAYLNVVCGNVYNEHFTKQWFLKAKDHNEKYNINLIKLLGDVEDDKKGNNGGNNKVKNVYNGDTIVWSSNESFSSVKSTMRQNNIHTTRYSLCRKGGLKGGLFDQMPVKASEGLVPRKKYLPAEQYGGYNRPAISFFVLTKYTSGKRKDVMLVPVEVMFAEKTVSDELFAKDYIAKRISKITGKNPDMIEFPIGLRPIKINTIFSLDGFLYTISGTSSGGRCVIMAPFMQLLLSDNDEEYVKKIERFNQKNKDNKDYRYFEKYDLINRHANELLFDKLVTKAENSIYSKRINMPIDILKSGKDIFLNLDIKKQSEALANIIQVFGSCSSGIDLSLIKGAQHAAATGNVSSQLSNWKKNYNNIRIVERSPSGIWETKSQNLIDLL